ncbi:hypothetical protein DV735_g2767, partial [Chaetothyriales sp. CBS 134920]
MLIESFVVATSAAHKAPQHLTAALKDVGIFQYELQPQPGLRHGFKKSSVGPNCLALSNSHIFAAQLDKAVVNVYNREKVNQEATVPFPERIRSLAFVEDAAVLILGTESGKLILWEVATGRLVTSSAAHLQPVSSLHVSPNNDYVLSGSSAYEDTTTATAPARTFSVHRSGITALTCGHSRPATNFAISASEDKTCYVWHIETVDRAVYLGSEHGGIMAVNLQSLAAKEETRGASGSNPTVELLSKDIWASTSQLGAINAIALSYDATSLLSSHTNGAVVHWDVAKQRMASEIFNFGQPVTNIQMLRPQGLTETRSLAYITPAIVKPRLELNNLDYDGWSDRMLDDAIHAIESAVDGPQHHNDSQAGKTEKLQEEVAMLKQQIALMNKVEQKRIDRTFDKVRRLEAVDAKRKQAYFDAKSQGKDGDAAMKPFDKEMNRIRAETPDDDEMDTS